ncbi:MAG: hypothetical protein JWM39_693 [Parcubacteria group bacterium]|nr:hypothetical protein [Parcubacteria group bacterium]
MRAFTLIETIVYLGLFGLLMSGVLPALGGMRAAAARTETQSLLLEEGTFLLETIDYTIGSGGAASSFHLSSSTLLQGFPTGQAVSGNQVQVHDLKFIQTSKTGGEPAFVDSSFTLTAHTDDGKVLMRTFTGRTYIDLP